MIMEYISNKRGRKRSKRKRRCTNNSKKSHNQNTTEVKSRKSRRSITKQYAYCKKYKIKYIMAANTFWENYKAAHEWQKRHNRTWWKSRCIALEHENYVLKEVLRDFVHKKNNCNLRISDQIEFNGINTGLNKEDKHIDKSNSVTDYTEDNIEFDLDENMMNFLALSIQHKIQLKNGKKSENIIESNKKLLESDMSRFHKRCDDAKLLYGEASSRILAMETALQTSSERYIDKAKPLYWPNIPIKL